MEKENRRLESNINPRNRIGRPVKSIKTRYAELMPKNDTRLGFLKHGDLVSGLTGAIQGYLGFSGAKQDALNEMAYYDYLAKLAEQERQDKLDQQAWEQEYKERALAQDLEKAQLSIAADNRRAEIARGYALEDAQRRRAQEVADAELKRRQAIEDRDAQYQHEQSIYNRNREDQLQAAIDAENRKRAYEEEQLLLKQLDPATQQQYYDMKRKGQNPVIVDNKVGTIGKFLGKPKYSLSVSEVLKNGKNYSSNEEEIMSRGLK